MSDWNISKTENPTNNVDLVEMLVDPSFGTKFTDHMAVIDYDSDVWKNHRVVPYAKLELDPACAVLHYSQEIFEGLKAYRRSDDSVWLFRPYENAKRFQASAERLCLPVLSEQDFVDSVVNLVQTDLRFVPTGLDKSLYLRPFMFASETFLGVHAAKE
ncbi:MAG: branched chain amino acid aminotransferase, partial [Bifidobacteriaceae bacterium]|nr:branched chain amino acid aminotransferase [Bifidobacteriaceae bacterium]